MTCDLHSTCGVSYRTYAAYKAHVYRHHVNQLHTKEKPIENASYFRQDTSEQQLNQDSHAKSHRIDNDMEENLVNDGNDDDDGDDYDDGEGVDDSDRDDDGGSDDEEITYGSFSNDILIDSSNSNIKKNSIDQLDVSMSDSDEDNDPLSVLNIKKSFGLFILQLREEFCLPKSITSSISNYIVSLLRNLTSILEQKVVRLDCENILPTASSRTTIETSKKFIELETVQHTTNDICSTLEHITKNEYQFLNFCNQYFNYTPPKEIVLSGPGENLESGYFIPIDQTLKSMLCHSNTYAQIVDHMKQQQEATINDNDLMFSFRDGSYGSNIDDSSLLIQLYIDEIGVTNPIGARKGQHKLMMIYFSLEDIPDQYRSKLDHIHLLAICESSILKVPLIYNTIR